MKLRQLWPFCIRLGIEFDAVDVQQDWWLPWFHCWRFGCRVGVLGLHLIVSISFLHDECPHGVGFGLECGQCVDELGE